MKSIQHIQKDIRRSQSEARESFAQSRVTTHLFMQQAHQRLDRSPALADYQAQPWLTRQIRNYFGNGLAVDLEHQQRQAASELLRSLDGADLESLTAVQAKLAQQTQTPHNVYLSQTCQIVDTEIARIGREQFFINTTQAAAGAQFVASYDVLTADLDFLTDDIDEALATLASRLSHLRQLDEDNKREFATQLGYTLTVKSAKAIYMLQSIYLAISCVKESQMLAADGDFDAVQTAHAALGALHARMSLGHWFARSDTVVSQTAWREAPRQMRPQEQERFEALSQDVRTALVAPATRILERLASCNETMLAAQAILDTAQTYPRDEAGLEPQVLAPRAQSDATLADAVSRLQSIVPKASGQSFDDWLFDTAAADLSVQDSRAQRALVQAIMLCRLHGVQCDVAQLVVPDILSDVSPRLLRVAQQHLARVDALRDGGFGGLPAVAMALDAMEAKVLTAAARAATSNVQMQLQDTLGDEMAADCAWVSQHLARASAGTKRILNGFIDAEWEVRLYYMRAAREPVTLEYRVIHGESFLQEHADAGSELLSLVAARYADAVAQHMARHPNDIEALADYKAHYGSANG